MDRHLLKHHEEQRSPPRSKNQLHAVLNTLRFHIKMLTFVGDTLHKLQDTVSKSCCARGVSEFDPMQHWMSCFVVSLARKKACTWHKSILQWLAGWLVGWMLPKLLDPPALDIESPNLFGSTYSSTKCFKTLLGAKKNWEVMCLLSYVNVLSIYKNTAWRLPFWDGNVPLPCQDCQGYWFVIKLCDVRQDSHLLHSHTLCSYASETSRQAFRYSVGQVTHRQNNPT